MKKSKLGVNPKISVVMPFRNSIKTLSEAINSILLQSFEDFELILVDDSSDDGSLSLLDNFYDDRIRVVANNSNLGLAKSLNKAISISTGRYIARMDADDICFPDRLKKQYDFLEKNPTIDLVGSSVLVFSGNGQCVNLLSPPLCDLEIKKSFIYASAPIYHPTWMSRAEWSRKNPYDSFFLKAQDYELLIRAGSHSKYANLPNVLLGYRLYPSPLTKRVLTRAFVFIANFKVYFRKLSFFYLLTSNFSNFIKLLMDCLGLSIMHKKMISEELLIEWKRTYLGMDK